MYFICKFNSFNTQLLFICTSILIMYNEVAILLLIGLYKSLGPEVLILNKWASGPQLILVF